MRRRATVSWRLVLRMALGLGGIVPSVALGIRPTPHQLIDQALRPVRDQLAQLNATGAERRELGDVMARGEALAAELVEARQLGAMERARSVARQIDMLARVLRGRIEASRAEAQAAESERAALQAEARVVQARAALERAAERRLEVERQAHGAWTPAPPAGGDADPSHAATPPARGTGAP